MLKTLQKTKLTETEELGFEILVSYTETWDIKQDVVEDFFGLHRFPDATLVNIELESIEVIVKGRGINILSQLTPLEKQAIIWEIENC